MTNSLDRYRGRRAEPIYFWLRTAIATLGHREITPLVHARLRGERIAQIAGLQHLPSSGAFTLAVNHYQGRGALDVAAAVLFAIAQCRPDAVRDIAFIVGQTPRKKNWLFSWARDWIFRRWAAHAIRIPLKNTTPSPLGLREWTGRNQSIFVFPEGKARLCFGALRDGAGRWLAVQALPTIPIGVWWVQGEGWHVQIGSAIQWPSKRPLHDMQLALKMAELLPPDLAPAWQNDLACWRESLHHRQDNR